MVTTPRKVKSGTAKPRAKEAVGKRARPLPAWAQEFVDNYKPPTKAELRARQRALREALKIRERLDIRPLNDRRTHPFVAGRR